jgi:hypothetical protein
MNYFSATNSPNVNIKLRKNIYLRLEKNRKKERKGKLNEYV